MNRRIDTKVELEKGLVIRVTGNFYSGCMATMEQPAEEPELDLDQIILIEGSLVDLIWFIEDNMQTRIFDFIQELAFNHLSKE